MSVPLYVQLFINAKIASPEFFASIRITESMTIFTAENILTDFVLF